MIDRKNKESLNKKKKNKDLIFDNLTEKEKKEKNKKYVKNNLNEICK